MAHHVPSHQLPEGLTFPPELGDRIFHDAQRGRLIFRGFMCKADFDLLSRLHDDWSYRRAVEDLFRLATLDPPGHSTHRLAALFNRLVSRGEGRGG